MRKKSLANRIRDLFSAGEVSDSTFDDLEDALIEGDVGVKIAMEVVDVLRADRSVRKASKEQIVAELKRLLEPGILSADFPIAAGRLNFLLVLGVNGVGKTTAIARIAHFYKTILPQDSILLCAGDTFRAAAVEQLSIHAERLGVRIVKQNQGADAGAVIFDALESGISRQSQLVIADTAGRMHNKADLVDELSKIDRIVRRKIDDAGYHKMLVIDATTGQNGLRQAEVFHEAIGVDSIFVAKYDSSGKGGVIIPISRQLGIPITFLGVGESYDAMERFDTGRYLESLVG